MSDAVTIFSSVVVSTLGTAALLFLLRNWILVRLKASIENEYNRQLEIHRAQLKSQADIELARLKVHLESAAAERTLRLSRVFDRTANVIATIYKHLVELREATQTLLGFEDFALDHALVINARKDLETRIRRFLEFFRGHKIYLSKSTAENVQLFSNAINGAMVRFLADLSELEKGERREIGQRPRFRQIANDEVPKLLLLLESDFRRTLGIAEGD